MKTFKMYLHRVHSHPNIWDAFATKNYVFLDIIIIIFEDHAITSVAIP